MPYNWPTTLVNRMASDQWVLFVGSGVSASCRNEAGVAPPSWPELLAQLTALIQDPGARAVGEQLIERRQLLAAADHARFCLLHDNNLDSYFQTLRGAVEGPQADRFTPSGLFGGLLNLEPRVVFTTNYDKLFETASQNGYRVHDFKSRGLGDDLRRGEPVLVKLHGTTDDINEIVLTRTDYARVMSDGRRVLDVLGALSLTSTILFVGYSLDDPDIQLVLQAVGRHTMSPEAHFMLAPEPESPARIPVFRESFGVSVLTYAAPNGDHSAAADALRDLSDLVLAAKKQRAGIQ